jgi:hypothetical protein
MAFDTGAVFRHVGWSDEVLRVLPPAFVCSGPSRSCASCLVLSAREGKAEMVDLRLMAASDPR